MTNSSGRCSSLSDPTALSETIRSTPSFLNPHMLARKFNSEGEILCPRPWRDKKDTYLPPTRPPDIRTPGPPPRGFDYVFFVSFKTRHRIQPAAADHTDLRVHSVS